MKNKDLQRIRLAKKLLKKAGCIFEICYLKGEVYFYGNGNTGEALLSTIEKEIKSEHDEMRELREQGLTLKAIGEKFGVSKQRVYQIIHSL